MRIKKKGKEKNTMDLTQMPKIYDSETGEVLQVNKLQPKTIEKYLKTLDDDKVSEILTQLNFVRKIADKIEKTTKNYIKSKIGDFKDETFFGQWRIKQFPVTRFDEKRFFSEGSPRDIKIYERIKREYVTTANQTKFG